MDAADEEPIDTSPEACERRRRRTRSTRASFAISGFEPTEQSLVDDEDFVMGRKSASQLVRETRRRHGLD